MTSPEMTIRKLLRRAATAPAVDLPQFIDAINNLHKLLDRPEPTDLEKRVARLEENQFGQTNGRNEIAARFR